MFAVVLGLVLVFIFLFPIWINRKADIGKLSLVMKTVYRFIIMKGNEHGKIFQN